MFILKFPKIHHLWKAILKLISTTNRKPPKQQQPPNKKPPNHPKTEHRIILAYFSSTHEKTWQDIHKNAVAKWIKSLHMQHSKRHMTKWVKIFDQIWAVYCAIHGKNRESSNTPIRYYQRLHIHNNQKYFIRNSPWSPKR